MVEEKIEIVRGVGRSMLKFNKKQERLNAGHLSLSQLEHTIIPTKEQLKSERKLIEFIQE